MSFRNVAKPFAQRHSVTSSAILLREPEMSHTSPVASFARVQCSRLLTTAPLNESCHWRADQISAQLHQL